MTDARASLSLIEALVALQPDARASLSLIEVLTSPVEIATPPPPSTGPTVRWHDGDSAEPASLLGWWDGVVPSPATALGHWDGTAIQPLA